LAEELVRLKVDIIVAPSSIYTEAAKRAAWVTKMMGIVEVTRGPCDGVAGSQMTATRKNITRRTLQVVNLKTMDRPTLYWRAAEDPS
jgi:hypothetical protein